MLSKGTATGKSLARLAHNVNIQMLGHSKAPMLAEVMCCKESDQSLLQLSSQFGETGICQLRPGQHIHSLVCVVIPDQVNQTPASWSAKLFELALLAFLESESFTTDSTSRGV